MNVLIVDSWLRDFLKTQATPKQIARCLSLCGPSVEKVIKKGKDWVYDIEITSNRPDTASVIGIAREAAAILPRFGIKARLVTPEVKIPAQPKKSLPLKVKISPPSICPRFSAIVIDKVIIKSSPVKIRNRLELSGLRSLNNIIDISNYLMIETGQPIHTFDYDKIDQGSMIVRLSQKGEKIKTLDKVNRTLPGDDIVIEDGKKRLIDLCGIMGGENTAIDHQTRRVLFFVQSYDPLRIRKTSMVLAHRTEAAVRFEKGIDQEAIPNVIWRGLKMTQKLAGASLASKLYDLYPQPQRAKRVKTNLNFISSRLGVCLPASEIDSILSSLGFEVVIRQKRLSAAAPSWRADDIAIPEDLTEEVARLYGYHNLPSNLPIGKPPSRPRNFQIGWEEKIKNSLKYWGFSEIYSYSLVSQELLKKCGVDPKNCLKLSNPLTEEWTYLRPSLIPSLLQVIAQNQENFSKLKIFEMANIYLPRPDKLPKEEVRLIGVIGGESFYQAKGAVESILEELGIKAFATSSETGKIPLKNFWHSSRTISVFVKGKFTGVIGEINPQIKQNFNIKISFFLFNLSIRVLTDHASWGKKYTPVPQYPPIIEDLTFIVKPRTPVGYLIQLIKDASLIIQSVELIDSYQDSHTFKITYQSPKKTLTDKEVGKVREKIIKAIEKKFKARLKTA